MNSYDVIVLGLGGMGSAALFELARRGCRVLGLEQFPLVHARGSSHGQTRIIRTAYYEHPDYVPLIRRAYERWYELEQLAGRHLLTRCDCLTIGPADGELVSGVRAAVVEHRLAAEDLSAGRVQQVSGFRVPAEFVGVIEANAGFLYVEDCVRAHLDMAEKYGAVIRAEEAVTDWKVVGDAVEVRTPAGSYHAAKLVITAGAWATQLLSNLGVPLTVMRQTLLWFAPHAPSRFRRDRFPIFICETPQGAFYGLPMIDPRGLKLARHYGAPELAHPDAVSWVVTPQDESPVRAFLDAYLPGLMGRRTDGQVCMYTLTPDRHFVIDRHPQYPNVAVAAGFSGHGFKFATVVGEILADLVEHGQTHHPIAMFRAGRFLSPRT
jgi:sarcosine oxidase